MAKSKFDRLLGAQLGFEDDDTVTTGDAEEIIMSAAVQPEDDMVDMQSDATQIEEAITTSAAVTDDSVALQEVGDALSQSTESGGLSADAAVYARLAIRGIVGRHSVALADAMIPSMESFGGSSSRARATASMEGAITEALKSFWNAIVAKMKKLFAYVKNWIMKVFGAAPKLKARAVAIGKKAANITGAAEEKTMDLSLVHQLQLKGKAPTPADATATAKELGLIVAGSLGNKTSGMYEGVFTEFDEILTKVDAMDGNKSAASASGKTAAVGATTVSDYYSVHHAETSDKVTAKITAVLAAASNGKADKQATEPTRWGNDLTVTQSDALFGDKMLVKTVSKMARAAAPGANGAAGATNDSFTLARYTRDCHLRITDTLAKPKDNDNSGSFKTLSSSDIRNLCNEVEDICDSVITYKKSWENREKYFAKMDSAAKKAIANAEKDKDDVGVKPRLVKDMALGMSTAMRVGVSYETSLVTYSLAVGRGLLTWCERSLSQYKSS